MTDCPNPNHARGLCQAHSRRLRVLGTVAEQFPVTTPGVDGSISHGYRIVSVPTELRHLTSGSRRTLEHRLVMGIVLGRPLLSHEVVHHRNGDRLDNRPENLELWSTDQPKGQRVEDKMRWAREILARYEPDNRSR